MTDKQVMQQALDALLGYKPQSLTHAKEQGTAIIALRETIAQPVQPCMGCNGHGEVGGLRSDGYDSEICPYCKGGGTEQIAQPVQPAYDQTALELCSVCGWKTLIPDDICLNCEHEKTLTKSVQPAIPYSGADESPPVFARRWKLAADGFGLQRDDNGNYVHIDDALSVLHALAQAEPLSDEQIDALAIDDDGLPNSHLEFARAIEAAHGIVGLQKAGAA